MVLHSVICLLLVLISISYAQVERTEKSASGKLGNERHVKKNAHSKPKLHYSTSTPHAETKYGVDLPSFAFDYSEYFSGAVIERSHDKDLHLSVFMVGHRTISTDFPFHAISTDEEVLHSWSKAIQIWDKTGRKKTHAPVARRLTRTAEGTANAPHSHHNLHSNLHSSGLVCVLQNNDASSSPVYQATAYWVQAEYDVDSTSNKNTFAILRCKLRHTALVHANLQGKELFVDIMRTTSHRKGHAQQTFAGNATGIAKNTLGESAVSGSSSITGTTSTSSIVATDTRGVVLSSFSVPWTTRVVGYPLQAHLNASTLDPWASTEPTPPTSSGVSPIPTTTNKLHDTTATADHQTTMSSGLGSKSTSTLLCVPSVRPLHPIRAQVSMPMLVEYIEHNLLLGFSHIMLGVALDWKSAYMAKHLHVLRSYIQAGKVSIYSTALPGFDDVSGFGGVQLNDAYAEQYFVNMCLYYAKGVYDYVSIGHVEEYIIPDKENYGAEEGSTFVHTVLKEFVSSAGVTNNTVFTASRDNNKISGGIKYAPCTYALSSPAPASTIPTTTLFHTTNLRGSIGGKSNTTSSSRSVDKNIVGKVSGKLDVYGIEDPISSFGNWGPGERAWGRDFFASSVPRLLHNPNHTYSVLFLPTDRVVRVEYSPSGVATGHCRSVASQQRRSKNSAYSVYNVGSGKNITIGASSSSSGGAGSKQGVAAMYTATSVLSSPAAALFVYKGSFPTHSLINTATITRDDKLQQYMRVRDTLSNNTTINLQKNSRSTIAELKSLIKEALTIHAQALQKASVFNPFSDNPIPDKSRLNGEIPTRSAIKAPFWQLCNTDYLKDVIRKVFHG